MTNEISTLAEYIFKFSPVYLDIYIIYLKLVGGGAKSHKGLKFTCLLPLYDVTGKLTNLFLIYT